MKLGIILAMLSNGLSVRKFAESIGCFPQKVLAIFDDDTYKNQ